MSRTRREHQNQKPIVDRLAGVAPHCSDFPRLAKESARLGTLNAIGFFGILARMDGHPDIKGRPVIEKCAALYQLSTGTRDNQYAHILPCSLRMNGEKLDNFFMSESSKKAIKLSFGLGVKAPSNWRESGNFWHPPTLINQTDSFIENFGSSTGAASALEQSANYAAQLCSWSADGNRLHNENTIAELIEEVYMKDYKPRQLRALANAITRLDSKIKQASPGQDQDKRKMQKLIIEKKIEEIRSPRSGFHFQRLASIVTKHTKDL